MFKAPGGFALRGASLRLAGGFDAAHHRTYLCTAGLIPNLQEHPRHRKAPKRGRPRVFNAAIHALRRRGKRPFAWEDTCKRLLLRCERLQQRHGGTQVMPAMLSTWRGFVAIFM